VIGHLKSDHRLKRNFLKGFEGDQINLLMAAGPTGNEYFLKDWAANETTFVKRPTGYADDFDDIVKWVSPGVLFSKMIEAGQLP